MKIFSITLSLCFFVPSSFAFSASSGWHELQGAALRLVTDDEPDENGILRGAFEIALKPGWKTYWRDPGPAGVAPVLDISIDGEPVKLEIDFPAPHRFNDGYSLWAGYKEPVTLAVNITMPSSATSPTQISANAFLGLCETICIPAQMEFSLYPSSTEESRLTVENAFSRLPEMAAENTLSIREASDKQIVFETNVSGNYSMQDLFVAGTDDLVLGTPELVKSFENRAIFNVPIAYRTKNSSSQMLAYTLVTDNQALSGKIALP